MAHIESLVNNNLHCFPTGPMFFRTFGESLFYMVSMHTFSASKIYGCFISFSHAVSAFQTYAAFNSVIARLGRVCQFHV